VGTSFAPVGAKRGAIAVAVQLLSRHPTPKACSRSSASCVSGICLANCAGSCMLAKLTIPLCFATYCVSLSGIPLHLPGKQ